jgi:hypothetical protein
MQDHRLRLNGDRRAVIDLPIKLLVAMTVLAISIPMLAQAMDDNREDMMESDMDREAGRIADAMAAVHYAGGSSSRTLNVDLPAGCEIAIGGNGSEAYSMRLVCDGRQIGQRWFERPVVAVNESVVLTGNCTVMVRCTGNGTVGVTLL